MATTSTSQSGLSRLSGVHQPTISQFLSGRIDFSDDQLDRLLACMGLRLEVTQRAVTAELTRSERRSWLLHRQISARLTPSTLAAWRPTIEANLSRLRDGVRGQPHTRNLERWATLLNGGDVRSLQRVLTGLDRGSIEMREVSPMSGLLSDEERHDALAGAI